LIQIDTRLASATHLVPIRLGKFHSRRTALDTPTVDHNVHLTTHEFKGAIKHGPNGIEVCEITDGDVGTPAEGPNSITRGGIGFVALDETYVRA
jgi:hypothetical protein